jgi:hypothetical protein
MVQRMKWFVLRKLTKLVIDITKGSKNEMVRLKKINKMKINNFKIAVSGYIYSCQRTTLPSERCDV